MHLYDPSAAQLVLSRMYVASVEIEVECEC